ncbi:MAG: hypothetical protein HETSPECPRED_000540 [Heterodermia speciosa]|uniref:Uncharacterized protein n=1 Tax=Heterodermia speciosa TaxID=116794 RepID=A0A8H3G6I3_9LECA|nr:MAG: hypothetical protein HETSPECPRED_000540 [Heterodermia speciosa]
MSNKRTRGSSPNEDIDMERLDKTYRDRSHDGSEDLQMLDDQEQSEIQDRAGDNDIYWLKTIGEQDKEKAQDQFEKSLKIAADKERLEEALKKIDEREESFKKLPVIPSTKMEPDMREYAAYRRRKEMRASAIE